MTGDELNTLLTELDWPYARVARELGCTNKLVRRWAAGEIGIPPEIAAWLLECRKIAFQIAWPKAPEGWRTNKHYEPAARAVRAATAARQRRRAARAA